MFEWSTPHVGGLNFQNNKSKQVSVFLYHQKTICFLIYTSTYKNSIVIIVASIEDELRKMNQPLYSKLAPYYENETLSNFVLRAMSLTCVL